MKTIFVILLSVLCLTGGEAFTEALQPQLQVEYESKSVPTLPKSLPLKVAQFYQKRGFQPAWAQENAWTPCAKEAVRLLKHAAEEGLDPKDYQAALQRIEKEAGPALSRAPTIAGETALTAAFLTYIEDIQGERLNPRKVDRKLRIQPEDVDPVAILNGHLQASQDCKWMATLAPQHPAYQSLKKLLAHYRATQDKSTRPFLPSGTKLEKGDQGADVLTLRAILALMGEISSQETLTNFFFDEDLKIQLKSFQAKHSLKADGVLGPKTLAILNQSDQDRINQIIVTMERWRWLPDDLGDRHIRVNIARFELEAVKKGEVVLRSPIIVGMTYRETPVFSAPMTNVIFNPSWHIPRGIAVNDKLPKARKDSNYFNKRGYVVYRDLGGGKLQRINPANVDWNSVSERNLNYRFRQPPGPKNALGKIRFSIKNTMNIYLHSTGKPELFEKDVRTFSSGCVRVEKHLELAEFVFDDPFKWPRETLKKSMSGTRTNKVFLPQSVPVHITYFTVWLDEQSQPIFAADIYDQDKKVWSALQKTRPEVSQFVQRL